MIKPWTWLHDCVTVRGRYFEFPVRIGDGQATKPDWQSCSMPQMRLGHGDIDIFLALKHLSCEISPLRALHCFFWPRMTLDGVFSRSRDWTGGTGWCCWDYHIHVAERQDILRHAPNWTHHFMPGAPVDLKVNANLTSLTQWLMMLTTTWLYVFKRYVTCAYIFNMLKADWCLLNSEIHRSTHWQDLAGLF